MTFLIIVYSKLAICTRKGNLQILAKFGIEAKLIKNFQVFVEKVFVNFKYQLYEKRC